MIRSRFLVLISVILLIASQGSAYFLGTAPGTQDIGEVERGESYQLEMYLTSNAEAPLLIQPGIVRPSSKFFEKQEGISYDFDPDQASQEDITDWIEFDRKSYTLNPDKDSRIELDSGEKIAADGSISYRLNIPRNAEPGYHAVTFNLDPEFQGEFSGSLQTRSISNPMLIFRVPGEAERELRINNIEGLRSGDNSARIAITIENTGTVTSQVTGGAFGIYDSADNRDGVSTGQDHYIPPGETKRLETTWSQVEEDIQAGNYRLQGNVDYVTGQAFIDDTFSISDFIQIRPSDNESGSGIVPSGGSEEQMPTMLILMFLVLMGSIMYVFELDPLLIVLAVGMLGISSFIWFSGLPMVLVALILLISAGIFYYGWM